MKCPACSKEYDDDFEYCPYCGADNLEVDRIRAEYDKQNEESVEEPIIGPNTKSIPYRMRYGHYTALFNMDDEEEAAYYNEITRLQNSNSIFTFWSFLLAVGLFASIFVVSMFHDNILYLTLGLIFLFGDIAGFLVVIKYGTSDREVARKQAEYLMYKVKKEGGSIIDYNEQDLSIVYGLHGKKYSVTIFIRRSRYDYNYHY